MLGLPTGPLLHTIRDGITYCDWTYKTLFYKNSGCDGKNFHEDGVGRQRHGTSLEKIEQIQRISAMLGSTITAGATVTVTTTDGRKRTGKLVSHQSGSRLIRHGTVTAHYGSIKLATDPRTVEINYLDIVWIAHTGRTGL